MPNSRQYMVTKSDIMKRNKLLLLKVLKDKELTKLYEVMCECRGVNMTRSGVRYVVTDNISNREMLALLDILLEIVLLERGQANV